VARRAPVANTNGHNTIHHPGVYAEVLQRVCEEECGDPIGWLLASDDDQRLAEFERGRAARMALCMREREGQPVMGLSCHLPDDMPLPLPFPPRFPGFEIVVTPDDTVRRMARTSKRG
jgi:hypothetical protein